MKLSMTNRGTESRTLFFVAIAFLLITLRTAFGGFSVTVGAPPATVVTIAIPVTGVTDYGTAFALILGIWLGREWQSKIAKPKEPNANT